MPTIAQQLQELAQIKADLKDAISAKGVTVLDTDAFNTYATKVGQISGGGGSSPIAHWDLTTSKTDDISGLLLTSPSNMSSDGIQASAVTYLPSGLIGYGRKIKIKFGTVSANFVTNRPYNLISFRGSSSYGYQRPSIRWNGTTSSGKWQILPSSTGTALDIGITSVNAFSNKELLIDVDGSGIIKLSLDGDLIYTATVAMDFYSEQNQLYFGASSINDDYGFYNFWIKEIEIG